MRRQVELGHEERSGEQHQQHTGDRHGQHLESVEPHEERDRADRSGKDEPRVPELDEDADEPEREHQRHDVRIDEEVERALPEGHLHVVDLRTGRVERQRLRLGGCPVDPTQEPRQCRCHHVDDVARPCLTRAVVGRRSYHRLRGGPVAAVLPRELPDVRRRVVDDLAPQVLGEVLPAGGDRGRGADVRLRRHGEHVGGLTDDGTRRVGARPAR